VGGRGAELEGRIKGVNGWREGRVGRSSAVMLLYCTGGVGEQCGKVTLPHCSPPPTPSHPHNH